MTFFEYMNRYQGKNTPRGDLAGDMAHDKNFPRNESDFVKIRGYLWDRGACRECIETFENCWKAYQKFLAKDGSKS